jgi:cytoskeletal protein RodZ
VTSLLAAGTGVLVGGTTPAYSNTPTLASLTLSGLTAASFLYSGASGLLASTAAPTNGQLLIGSTGVAPVAATLTAGSGISITNGAGQITISTSTAAGATISAPEAMMFAAFPI